MPWLKQKSSAYGLEHFDSVHILLPLMNSFNKTKDALFSMQAMHSHSPSILYIYTLRLIYQSLCIPICLLKSYSELAVYSGLWLVSLPLTP